MWVELNDDDVEALRGSIRAAKGVLQYMLNSLDSWDDIEREEVESIQGRLSALARVEEKFNGQ